MSDETGLTVPCGGCGDPSPHDAHLAPGALEQLGAPPSIHDAGTARGALGHGMVVLITPGGDFLYPDNPEDEAIMVRAHDAVRVVGLICRCMRCCCRPGTGHLSHPRPAPL